MSEILTLDIPVDQALDLDRELRLAVLALVVLAGRVLLGDDLKLVVPTVAHSGYVFRLDIQDLVSAEAAVAHESDRDLALEGLGRSRKCSILLTTHPDIPRAVFIPFGSHCTLLVGNV